MTLASYMRRELIVRMDALTFDGKIFAYPAADWHATGREKLFTNYNAFSTTTNKPERMNDHLWKSKMSLALICSIVQFRIKNYRWI